MEELKGNRKRFVEEEDDDEEDEEEGEEEEGGRIKRENVEGGEDEEEQGQKKKQEQEEIGGDELELEVELIEELKQKRENKVRKEKTKDSPSPRPKANRKQQISKAGSKYGNITLKELVDAGLLKVGAVVDFRDITGVLTADGSIYCREMKESFVSPSSFATKACHFLKPGSTARFNGWTVVKVIGGEYLCEYREKYMQQNGLSFSYIDKENGTPQESPIKPQPQRPKKKLKQNFGIFFFYSNLNLNLNQLHKNHFNRTRY